MEIAFRTKITLDEEQVVKAKRFLIMCGVIEDLPISEKQLGKIIKQEMMYGALKYLVNYLLLEESPIAQIQTLVQINNTVPNGYTRANGVD